jgi:hypothetical protein
LEIGSCFCPGWTELWSPCFKIISIDVMLGTCHHPPPTGAHLLSWAGPISLSCSPVLQKKKRKAWHICLFERCQKSKQIWKLKHFQMCRNYFGLTVFKRRLKIWLQTTIYSHNTKPIRWDRFQQCDFKTQNYWFLKI